MSTDYLRRFAGIGKLYGAQRLDIFANSHVLVIGLGGVGSWAAEALVRSGIGQITLIDMDDICISNTNRQIHTTQATLGQLKTRVMASRLRDIHPHCQITEIDDFITPDNLTDYVRHDVDFVIDGIDSARVKIALIIHCRRQKIPLIVSGGAGGQTDPSQVQCTDITRAFNDPLLAKIRRELRRLYGYSRHQKQKFNLPCVFSSEPLIYPKADGSVCRQKTTGGQKMDCRDGLGATTMVTASFGFQAASFVLKKLSMRE